MMIELAIVLRCSVEELYRLDDRDIATLVDALQDGRRR